MAALALGLVFVLPEHCDFDDPLESCADTCFVQAMCRFPHTERLPEHSLDVVEPLKDQGSGAQERIPLNQVLPMV